MVEFKVNTPSVKVQLKKQICPVCIVQGGAGGLIFLPYLGLYIAFFKIVPKEAPAYDEAVKGKLFKACIEGTLQGFCVHLLMEFAAETENLGIILGGAWGKNFCSIIKPVPFGGIHGAP
jgi:hypothetical protein